MRTLCTLSDNNYILNGLALYDSLVSTNEHFELHYLCLDDIIYNKMLALNLNNIVIWDIKKLLSYDVELLNTKNLLSYKNFCFSLASYFSNFILKYTGNSVYYLDSDLFFYRDLDIIENEIGDKSIGIIKHRHVEKGHFVGAYNVGLVYFKNNDIGIECSERWWRLVIDQNNPYYTRYGTCGDQKYLELFEIFYGQDNVSIIDDNSSHVAPFNFLLYDYSIFDMVNKKIIYLGKEHYITFCHFMQFTPNFNTNTYDATKEPNNQEFIKIPQVRLLYDDYYNKIKESKIKYNI